MTISPTMRWRIALVLWMGAIFVVTSVPGADADTTERVLGGFNYLARKSAHFTEFAALSLLWFASLAGGLSEWRSRTARLAWGFTALYGLSDEIHQIFVPNRSPSWHDVALDATSALIGLLLLRYFTRRARLSRPHFLIRHLL